MRQTDLHAADSPSLPSSALRHGRMGRWLALDGVRGLAIMLVMIEHTHLAPFHGGGLGVDLFFVLSGFLITGLLLAEFQRSGGLDIRRFYYRRALRLLPALLVLVAATAGLALAYHHSEVGRATLAMAPKTLFYVANLGRTDVGDPSLLAHTWSLSIEEQFYLIWPLLLLLLLRSRLSPTALVGVALAVAGLTTVTRTVSYLSGPDTPEHFGAWYFRTDTKVDALLLGCTIALLLASELPGTRLIARLPIGAIGLGSFLILLAVVPWVDQSRMTYMVQLSVFRLASAGLILAFVLGSRSRSRLERVFKMRWLRFAGVLSYSLYLWHFPVFMLAQHRFGRSLKSLLVELPITILLAYGSYRLVERPFLRARERLPSTQQEPAVRGELATLAEAGADGGDRPQGVPWTP
jgi:peptidoglycan/LPS O-acetylase OafA/YrhL